MGTILSTINAWVVGPLILITSFLNFSSFGLSLVDKNWQADDKNFTIYAEVSLVIVGVVNIVGPILSAVGIERYVPIRN